MNMAELVIAVTCNLAFRAAITEVAAMFGSGSTGKKGPRGLTGSLAEGRYSLLELGNQNVAHRY